MNKEKLEALQRLALQRYGERIKINRETFTIDGIRLFIESDQWRKTPELLLDHLGDLLSNEKQARAVSETAKP
jgi:hypothetical protein